MLHNRVYLDNAATTPISREVIVAMHTVMMENYGNPSSIHAEGREARALIERARKAVAGHIGASIGEIFFTSCGTESNNTIIKCSVRDLGVRRIISSKTEHHCILHSLDRVEKDNDVEIVYLNLDQYGYPDLDHLRSLLGSSSEKTLVTLMHSNNETGTMISIEEVGALCEEYGAYFHSDTVQTMGFFPIDVNKAKVSFLSGSAHKFHGPKGIGFLYMNNDNILQPYVDGGAQERNMRAGTENIYGIVGLAKALDLAHEQMDLRREHIEHLRDYFAKELKAAIPDIKFYGDYKNGHYKVLNVSFPPSPKTDLLLLNLDIAGISVSGGSACSSGADAGSHVIDALGGEPGWKSIRFSFSHYNTMEDMDRVLDTLKQCLEPMVKK